MNDTKYYSITIDKPLSEVLRPNSLKDFVGQDHLVSETAPIFRQIKNKAPYSMIFWGPPGCGKTTLARIIANETESIFYEITPTSAGVADIKKIVIEAKNLFAQNKKVILFVDEIHRFSKAQQDYLLKHVEDGTIILIGATTENPSFEIISPLLSRTSVYVFKPLTDSHLFKLLNKCLTHLNKRSQVIKLQKQAREFLLGISQGDGRFVINSIQALVNTGYTNIDLKIIQTVLQKSFLHYDKKGEEHYNTISAFIKSMRAGDVDSALYYLARMVEAGEDPLFIARRMIIFASEDIGIANNTALVVANSVFDACSKIGYPECGINLAHGVVFLSFSQKSRKSYDAFRSAQRDVLRYKNLPIPLEVRNSPTKLMKDLNYGKGYEMYPKNHSFLPETLKGKKYFK